MSEYPVSFSVEYPDRRLDRLSTCAPERYGTDRGQLAAMGAVSGAVLGAAQGVCLAVQGRTRLAAGWAAAMPILMALDWSATTISGIDVEGRYTVFGAAGAVVFMLLSGLVLARLAPTPVAPAVSGP